MPGEGYRLTEKKTTWHFRVSKGAVGGQAIGEKRKKRFRLNGTEILQPESIPRGREAENSIKGEEREKRPTLQEGSRQKLSQLDAGVGDQPSKWKEEERRKKLRK